MSSGGIHTTARCIIQARPERHCELGSVARGKLQEFSERVRRDAFILPLGIALGKLSLGAEYAPGEPSISGWLDARASAQASRSTLTG
jgi:hypothetical protein